MPEFFAPAPLAAVALMVLNDRVLKWRFHNEITGKLSDIAVCFLLPLFISAFLGIFWRTHGRARVVLGGIVTVFAFTAQEIWPAFQRVFLSSLRVVGGPLGLGHFGLTTDLSDLWTMLMVPVAVAYGWRRLRAASQTPSTTTSASGTCSEKGT